MLEAPSQRVLAAVASAYEAPVLGRAQTTDPTERLDLLDALRGFALAGVWLANLVAFSLYAFLPSQSMAALATADVDRLLDPALTVLVSGKFFPLFSLLFGVGFSLQMQRTNGHPTGQRRYLRRLGALFVIGLLHAYLLWWGDVLRYYAVLGLMLLPLYGWPAPRLVTLGAVMIVVQPLLAQLFPAAELALVTQDRAYAAALAAFSSSDWSTMLRGNRLFADWWLPAHWGTAMSVAGCMLIGMALGRSGALRDPVAHAQFWRRLLLALPVGLALALALTLSDYGRLPWPGGWQHSDSAKLLLRVLNRAAGPILGLGYMAGLVWVFGTRRGQRVLHQLVPVGRMALSNYLGQTLVGIGLFYGIGLGLGPRYGLAGVVTVWFGVFLSQIALSRWWLARYRFGPVEWLWRGVTYGCRPPMRR